MFGGEVDTNKDAMVHSAAGYVFQGRYGVT